MKKLFAGLLVLLALVLASPTAMAGRVFCNNCQGWKNMEFVRYQYKADTYHQSVFQCPDCKLEYFTSSVAHTETIAATCQSPAYCEDCKSYYGSKAGHNWSAWSISDENQHVRTCQTPGCDAVEYADHTGGGATCIKEGTCTDCGASYHTDHNWGAWKKADENQHVSTCQNSGCNQTQSGEHTGGNATCSTEGTCTVCYGSYKDSNNHTGPYTNAYAPSASSATQHTVTETCTGCGKISRTYDEDHDREFHAAQAPTCKAEGWKSYETCKHCTYSTYSAIEPDPNAHVGSCWTTYKKTSETQHALHALYDCCGKLVQGSPEAHTPSTAATCTTAAYCADCDSNYGDPDPDAHNLKNHDAQAPTCTAIGWDAYETCSRCDYTTYVEKKALGHDAVKHDAQAATCTEIGWDAYETCSRCDYSTYAEKPALGHDAVKHDAQAATCTAIGWDAYETCSRCDYSTYVEKKALGHDAVKHDAQAATCTEIGWDAYETCSRCDYSTYIGKSPLGHNYAAKTTKPTCTEKGYTTYTCTHCQDSYRDGSTSPLGHWYGEWSPNADGTNSASCLRDKYKHTVDCAGFGFALTAEDVRTEFVLCPVCGEVSQIRLIDENGEVLETLGAVRLLLAKNTAAEALTKWLPRGELVVRMGALPRGELLMSVAFEWGGEPTQPTGQVKLTLPAQLVDGYSLYLLFEDGTETELTLEGDEEEETVSFTLDFTNSETPVQVIRLIPEV